ELLGGRRGGLARAMADALGALVGNPLVVASAAGIAWSSAGWALPAPVATLFELLGASASPSALFAIGLFLAGRPLGADLAEVGWIAVLKLIWQPLVTWWLARRLGLDPFWTMSAVLLAALPTGALTFIIAQEYRVYAERASSAILVSTVASVVTLSLLLALYGPAFAPG